MKMPARAMASFGIGPAVRARPEPSVRVKLRGQYPLVREGSATCWAELCRLGEFKGHWSGAEFNLTHDVFAAFIRNFERQQNALPIKYGHPMEEGTPCAGWLHKLAVRGDWLCGFIEWTDRAAEQIRAGEQRFTSIVFDTKCADRISGNDQGPTLFEVGLVGSPFIDGQTPLSLAA